MGKYKTIVIDPPWKISLMNPKIYTHSGLSKQLPYKTMTDKEIENFAINDFADAECDLFLWTTNSKLHTALHILEKWGFRYSNLLVWNKLDGLNHNGVHNVLEFVIYAYRGKRGLDYTRPIKAYFEEKRRKHSQKPNIFYSKIREVTKEPRIDIFARRRHYGFDAFGDQVQTQVQMPLQLYTCFYKKGVPP